MRRIEIPPEQSFRSFKTLHLLAEMHIRLICPREDPLWDQEELGDQVQRAYWDRDKHDLIIPPLSPVYIPDHIEDWEGHPDLLRALSIYTLTSGVRAPRLVALRINQAFFILGKKTALRLVRGEIGERDVLAMLERSGSN